MKKIIKILGIMLRYIKIRYILIVRKRLHIMDRFKVVRMITQVEILKEKVNKKVSDKKSFEATVYACEDTLGWSKDKATRLVMSTSQLLAFGWSKNFRRNYILNGVINTDY